MKVFNISDVPSSKLKQFNMDNQTVCLGSKMILPGCMEEVEEGDPNGTIKSLVDMGVISVGDPPVEYRVKKDKAPPAPAAVAPAPVPADVAAPKKKEK